jgi:hypothetical protein
MISFFLNCALTIKEEDIKSTRISSVLVMD